MRTFSDEELIDLFNRQLPDLLDRRPDLEPLIYHGFLAHSPGARRWPR